MNLNKRHRILAILLFLMFAAPFRASAQVIINEIHYFSPSKNEPAEFVELYNAGKTAVDLSGWSFISGVHYKFPPETSLAPDSFLVIARDPAYLKRKFGVVGLGPFSGKLSHHGEKLVLQNALGNVENAVDYKNGSPWPALGESPGHSLELVNASLDNRLGGSWRSSVKGPTPGKPNSVYATSSPPQVQDVKHSPPQPKSAETVKISAKVIDPDGVASVKLLYQIVEPGKYIELTDPAYKTTWISVEMNDRGINGDEIAGDNIYTVEVPPTEQKHRRLIRYRITATDSGGRAITIPYADPQPNFAYFVYDGVPPWRGAIQPGSRDSTRGKVVEYGTNVMRRLPVYHLIAKKNSVEASTWREQYGGEEYKWAGTLVYDGKVYDHIHYRTRGGQWRYAMGKNMWKFSFHRGHEFVAQDNYGRTYASRWSKLNLGACIQQGDYGHRGEQGMFEAVGFRLFNLAGIESPHTHWIQFRIIDDAVEANPANQYDGDFWGLYLVVENEGGSFLHEHGLPDGNLYKMESGTGDLSNQGATGVADKSDLNTFMAAYRGNPPEVWWRANLDLPRYYSYRSIIEGIHHYDVDAGKNYFYFHNPQTGKWQVHPWDIDLSWADNMYGWGNEPFKRILSHPAFRLEYQNRLRELRDLLFNSDQTHKLIDEYAAIISDPRGGPSMVDADRAMWDYHPVVGRVMKGGSGLFYQASRTKTFAGMVQLMKDYVNNRSALIDQVLLRDPQLSPTPTITATGPTNFPVDHLAFRTAVLSGSNLAAMKWRLAEITDKNAPAYKPNKPGKYEITATWESEELTTFKPDLAIPPDVAKPGHAYRVRVRMKDSSGRWSHWSAPVQFIAGGSSTRN